ncbi:YbiU family protein [Arsenicicoccus sp. oral taxon 190]|uniref:YbiU family protein n=1 Tax=Arsenicicoccus sp. oral taxon 190 TaxID=1658671 RepID=UPI00067A2B7D|nr:YbiU family protein [Arsenicicoccus sp. oral taxon 190]AKT50646.1 hypothetical protein ADJ73_03790 [Arsenicicoccus sp. oral taxon 190]
MTTTATPAAADQLPDLPHWETLPDDHVAATREVKAAIKARLAAAGTSAQEVFETLEREIAREVEEVVAELARGENPWPVVDFADIEAGTVSPELRARIARRGCAVVRGTFPRAQAEQWDRDIVDYTTRNAFFESYRGPGDDFFGSVGSKPEIYPIYWSSAQMEARQSPRMAAVQAFLNSFWTSETDGHRWFDPDRDTLYPDRIRRRPPGASSRGLGTHLDPGTLDLWMTQGYQRHFRHLWDGDVLAYDPWDASYRTEAAQYAGSTMCSVFRTFQGWTALSQMQHDQGVLHVVPIPRAMGYLMLRPLLEDIAADDLCGVRPNSVFPATEQHHKLLLQATASIPDVEPGDTVWWHCDMIHGVAPVEDQQGWGNVMYIPAAPWCAKNEAFAARAYAAFESGRSAPDFPEEDYEAAWPDRYRPEQLTEIGRRGFGLE